MQDDGQNQPREWLEGLFQRGPSWDRVERRPDYLPRALGHAHGVRPLHLARPTGVALSEAQLPPVNGRG